MVILMVSKGERPLKPVSAEVLGLTPAVWELTKRCWLKKAVKRPDTSEVLAHLEGMSLPTYFEARLSMTRDEQEGSWHHHPRFSGG